MNQHDHHDNVDLDEIVYLHALNCIPSFGPKRIAALLREFGSARKAWAAPDDRIASLPVMKSCKKNIREEKAAIDPAAKWRELEIKNISTLSVFNPGYPPLLKETEAAPPLLYYRGDLRALAACAVAIVGSRRCTFYGKEVASRLAAELAKSGVCVISGMALGIDTAAHRGALEHGGLTVAVLGCGLDHCYPPANRELMEQIAAEGLLLSEFPPGVKPLPAHFPRRNRIISGLTLGTVVVEATAKSGSLITADYALEQNRDVFAVPGNVGSPYSRGCHQLIKEGAKLVESAADILEELNLGFDEAVARGGGDEEKAASVDSAAGEDGLQVKSYSRGASGPGDSPGGKVNADMPRSVLSPEEKTLLTLIPYRQTHIDDLVRYSKKPPANVIATLLSLELKGLVRQSPGKHFCRA